MAAPNIINVSSIFAKTLGSALSTTTTTNIVTCPSDRVLKINSVVVSNVNGTSSADATVYFWDDSVGTRYALAFTIGVPADASLVVVGKDTSIYLEEGDRIEAGSSSVGTLNIIVSYEEIG
jgi:hypothetical protein